MESQQEYGTQITRSRTSIRSLELDIGLKHLVER